VAIVCWWNDDNKLAVHGASIGLVACLATYMCMCVYILCVSQDRGMEMSDVRMRYREMTQGLRDVYTVSVRGWMSLYGRWYGM
jgi:hypothetical protein